MGFFGKHDNTDVLGKDPEKAPKREALQLPEPEIQEPEEPEEEVDDLTLRVTFQDGAAKTFTCSSYVTPDSDGDACNIVLTTADDKDIWLNERYVVSIEEL